MFTLVLTTTGTEVGSNFGATPVLGSNELLNCLQLLEKNIELNEFFSGIIHDYNFNYISLSSQSSSFINNLEK